MTRLSSSLSYNIRLITQIHLLPSLNQLIDASLMPYSAAYMSLIALEKSFIMSLFNILILYCTFYFSPFNKFGYRLIAASLKNSWGAYMICSSVNKILTSPLVLSFLLIIFQNGFSDLIVDQEHRKIFCFLKIVQPWDEISFPTHNFRIL